MELETSEFVSQMRDAFIVETTDLKTDNRMKQCKMEILTVYLLSRSLGSQFHVYFQEHQKKKTKNW